MTAIGQIYKCLVCGNIVEVVHQGKGTLVCCGKPMELQAENTADASREKHVPVISTVSGCTKVSVGSAPHPMEEGHYIEWIELAADGKVLRAYLKPGRAPEAEFEAEAAGAVARAYCNLHGLWRSA
jgi:superoxide reductase